MTSLKVLALALSLMPMCLAAQETSSDTSGFHAGQWGVQFGVDGYLANVGILRFTSPRSAWLLLVDVDARFLSGTSTDPTGTSDADTRNVYFATGFGKRFYQAPRHKVRSFQSVGLIGTYSDQKSAFLGAVFKSTQWSAGALGELGAGYWVTSNLSLGGTAALSGGYAHSLQHNAATDIKQDGWFVSGVNVLLVVGLYF